MHKEKSGMFRIGKYHVTVGPKYVESLSKFCVLGCRLNNFGPRLEALSYSGVRVWVCVCVLGCVLGGMWGVCVCVFNVILLKTVFICFALFYFF